MALCRKSSSPVCIQVVMSSVELAADSERITVFGFEGKVAEVLVIPIDFNLHQLINKWGAWFQSHDYAGASNLL